jgi:hypothetical protein
MIAEQQVVDERVARLSVQHGRAFFLLKQIAGWFPEFAIEDARKAADEVLVESGMGEERPENPGQYTLFEESS